MKFFDVSSSIEVPNLPAELFDRKLVSALNRCSIKFEKLGKGNITFRASFFQFSDFRYRRLIFRGISCGEIEFFNQAENLIVRFNLSFMPTRVLLRAIALVVIVISISQHDYPPLIMAGWVIIVYFVVRDSIRYKFKKWFSRFTK